MSLEQADEAFQEAPNTRFKPAAATSVGNRRAATARKTEHVTGAIERCFWPVRALPEQRKKPAFNLNLVTRLDDSACNFRIQHRARQGNGEPSGSLRRLFMPAAAARILTEPHHGP